MYHDNTSCVKNKRIMKGKKGSLQKGIMIGLKNHFHALEIYPVLLSSNT
jgi:hypothetical protein